MTYALCFAAGAATLAIIEAAAVVLIIRHRKRELERMLF